LQIRAILVPISTSDKQIRLRIWLWILLLLSAIFKTARNFFFFSKFYCLLLFEATFTSVFKDKRSHVTLTFLKFCFTIEGYGSGFVSLTNGSGWPQNIRIIQHLLKVKHGLIRSVRYVTGTPRGRISQAGHNTVCANYTEHML
jgi:hypothetical protein